MLLWEGVIDKSLLGSIKCPMIKHDPSRATMQAELAQGARNPLNINPSGSC